MIGRNLSRGILFALALVTVAQTGFAQPGASPTIRSIVFAPDSPYETAKLADTVAVKVGQPLGIRDVQKSIKSLFSTGDFRDVQADVTPAEGGVTLTFILSLNFRIDSIEFVGVDKNKARAEKEVLLRPGDVLSLSAVDRSAVAIQGSLARRGYLEATVDPETRFKRELNRADVVFHITEGPEAKIADVDFEGNLAPFTKDELIKQMSRKPGKTFRLQSARDDAGRMETFFFRKKHRKADVRFQGETYDPATDSVRLRYKVTVGPQVRVEVSGIPRRSIRRLVPFKRGEGYSEDVIDRSADRIVNHLQRRGHFLAAVDVKEEMQSEQLVVIFNVNPGKKYRVDEVVFQGNKQMSDRKLRKVAQTGPPGGFRRLLSAVLRRPMGVTQENLNDDRDALETFYRLEGFTEARVSQPVATPAPDGTLGVTFPIVEGPRTLLTEITIEGNEQVPGRRLKQRLVLREGDPLNPLLLAGDLVALKTFYGDRGNVEIQVAPQLDFTPDRTGAKLIYRITEGPIVSVDEVVVRGNTYTKTSVVLKKAGLRKGQPFSFRRLFEAQRDLYRLGIFRRVDLLPERGGVSVADRDLVIQVEEGKNLTVAGAVGYSTDQGARGTATISHRNLFGSARYLGLEARISERENRFFVTYREPFIFNYDIPTQFTVFKSGEIRNDGDIRIERLGTFIEASKVQREQTRWSLRYEYRIVDVECNNRDLCRPGLPISVIGRQDQEIEISSLTPTFFWDRRDDPVDPHGGFYASASLEYAFPLASAKNEFVKEFAQGAWYRPVSKRSLIAVSGRLGLIEPLGKRTEIVDGVERDLGIPFSERFTAGGEVSHRAFRLDELGILGSLQCVEEQCGVIPERATVVRDPVTGEMIARGGNALALINIEYRFPLFGSLGGAAFVDAGNVWSAIDEIELSEARYGVGLGVRYITPVGPVRFDFGYKLDRQCLDPIEPAAGTPCNEKEDPFAMFLSLGHAF